MESPTEQRCVPAIRQASTGFAGDPNDTGDIRSQKLAVLLIAGSCSVAGIVWFSMYLAIFGWHLATWLPLVFTIVVGTALLLAHRLRNHYIAVYAQIVSIIGITFAIQWIVGGLFDSGLVLLWAFVGPLVALSFLSLRQSILWFGVFVSGVIATVAFDTSFTNNSLESSDLTRNVLFVLNMGFMSLIVFGFTGYYVRATVTGRATADRLLLNILPRNVAEDLKQNGATPARYFEEVSVVFADVVGSTAIFAGMPPGDVLDWLNEVFAELDACVERHGLEKLHTAGDGYMAASGVPESKLDHATAAVQCCLDMARAVSEVPSRNGKRLELRFGVNSGPVVAGVIGRQKFRYDIWGDTVNVASRIEATSDPGRVQISEATRDLVVPDFELEPRGSIAIKGKGQLKAWFVTGPVS